jgi:hypothetical protein
LLLAILGAAAYTLWRKGKLGFKVPEVLAKK